MELLSFVIVLAVIFAIGFFLHEVFRQPDGEIISKKEKPSPYSSPGYFAPIFDRRPNWETGPEKEKEMITTFEIIKIKEKIISPNKTEVAVTVLRRKTPTTVGFIASAPRCEEIEISYTSHGKRHYPYSMYSRRGPVIDQIEKTQLSKQIMELYA
jgi:hypothetical protein